MFIPNKTYHAMKVWVLGIIATLLLVIAGESVLYTTILKNQNQKIKQLSFQLDSLMVTSRKIDKNSMTRDTHVQSQITDAVTLISSLQTTINTLQTSTEMLIINECKVMPYYMDKGLLATCKNKGF